MKKFITVLLILLALWSPAYAAPKKIVSLTPVGTEILFALGQGNKIAGVTTYCDWPPEAKQKKCVGDYFNGTNLERLLAGGVDLVVVSDLQDSLILRLKQTGIKYAVIKQATIQEVLASIKSVGKICGEDKKADSLVRGIQKDLDTIRKKTAKYPKPSVVICVSRELSEPRIRSFYAAGHETFYSELLEIAGGKNIVKSRATNYQRISYEGLLSLNPDRIIDVVGDKSVYHSDIKKVDLDKIFDKNNLKRQWTSLAGVKAAVDGNIHIFSGTLYLRPGPRMAQIALSFAKALHPEAFR
ncbi:MAG: ABC transporter substrate-binding protein [Synergistaceae bacterium]|nr:ABC transporter substrate-binding protein [Candidatus Equadaptatus faecalis]